MAMPLDLGKVRKVADKIQDEVDKDIILDIYIDSTSNEKFLDSFVEYFNNVEEGVIVRYVEVSKFDGKFQPDTDFAIILAGEDGQNCAEIYNKLNQEHDKLVICINPNPIVNALNMSDYDCDKNLILCPDASTYTFVDTDDSKEINFDDYSERMNLNLKEKFENWIFEYSQATEIAYAAKFPALRPKVANSLINTCTLENAGIGLINILPGADMPLMTLNQVRMLLQLAAIYGYQINEDRVIEIITIVASAFGMRKACNLVKTFTKIPHFLVNGSFGFSATFLLGNIAREYFASGYAIDGLVEKCKTYFKK